MVDAAAIHNRQSSIAWSHKREQSIVIHNTNIITTTAPQDNFTQIHQNSIVSKQRNTSRNSNKPAYSNSSTSILAKSSNSIPQVYKSQQALKNFNSSKKRLSPSKSSRADSSSTKKQKAFILQQQNQVVAPKQFTQSYDIDKSHRLQNDSSTKVQIIEDDKTMNLIETFIQSVNS